MKKIIILFLYCLLWVGTINAQSGEPFSWEIREDVLYIHGDGAMPDYVESFVDGYYTCEAPWFEMNNTFSKVEINEGITNISDNSFFLCNNIVSVSIPSTVT
jgi:hypothetical protein